MSLENQFENVWDKINSLSQGRKVLLVAVSKKQPLTSMLSYLNWCKLNNIECCFGENYVDEFLSKLEACSEELQCHFIGRMQGNKADAIVKSFNCIETIDSKNHYDKLLKACLKHNTSLDFYLQVNISRDPAKAGIHPERLLEDFESFELKQELKLKGLMTITELYENPSDARGDFIELRKLRDKMEMAFGLKGLELSMGMSDDYEVALEEGASLLRIGSALFGARAGR